MKLIQHMLFRVLVSALLGVLIAQAMNLGMIGAMVIAAVSAIILRNLANSMVGR